MGHKMSADLIYILTTIPNTSGDLEAPPGEAIRIDADSMGRVLFRDPVPKEEVEAGFRRCIQVAQNLLTAAASGLSGYEVDELTLKLSLDSKVGCSFIADAKLAAGIEVKIKRQPRPLPGPYAQDSLSQSVESSPRR